MSAKHAYFLPKIWELSSNSHPPLSTCEHMPLSGRHQICIHTSLIAIFLHPGNHENISIRDTLCQWIVKSFRPTHQSASSFRPRVSGHIDIWYPRLETMSSLSTCTIFTVMFYHGHHFCCCICMICTISQQQILKCRERLTPEVLNMLWKRSVGWGVVVGASIWTLYHGLDHQMHDLSWSTCNGNYKIIIDIVII